MADEPPHFQPLLRGMEDTLRLLRQALRGADAARPLERFAARLADALAEPPQTPAELARGPAGAGAARRRAASTRCRTPAMAADVPLQADPRRPEAERWALALKRQCEAALIEVHALAPPGPRRSSAGEWDEAALAARRDQLLQLSERIGAMADMDFGFLYDPARDLLSIGYNVDDRRRDACHYDLLASEVRLASFVAISSGQIPQASWFALGRQLATLEGKTVLLSWSGSMFEYLMPMLVMPSYENTLLDETMRGAVERQVRYGTPARRALGHLRIGLQRHRRRSSTISTGRSACRGSDSSAVSPPTWWSRPTRR